MKQLQKWNASYNNRWTDYNRLLVDCEKVDTEHGRAYLLIGQAAQAAVERAQALRRSGMQGRTVADFLSDKEVKAHVAGTRPLVDSLEQRKADLKAAARDCQDAFEDLQKAAAKEAEGRFSGKADVEKVGKKGAADMAELAAACTEMVRLCGVKFGWVLKWKAGDERSRAQDVLDEAFEDIGGNARDAALETIQHRLEPRLVTKRLNAARVILEALVAVVMAKGDGKGSGPKSSPIDDVVDREKRAKEARPLLAKLVESRDELKDALGAVPAKRLQEMKSSDIKADKVNYETYVAALKHLQTMNECVGKAQALLDKLT